MVDFTRNRYAAQAEATGFDAGLRAYMLQVFNYMAAGLGLTGVIAFLTSSSESMMQAIFGTPLGILVMLAPIGFVLFMGFRLHKISLQTAQLCFWLYAGIMGLSMASIFMMYTSASIAKVFFITAGTFGAMSIYGYTTKRDLTAFGSFLIMGLIGIILASLVNMFLKSSGLDFAISILGVLIFTGLTAFDVQRIKETYFAMGEGTSDGAHKMAIMGALSLYMDFLNLFLSLLKFFGDRR